MGKLARPESNSLFPPLPLPLDLLLSVLNVAIKMNTIHQLHRLQTLKFIIDCSLLSHPTFNPLVYLVGS